MELIIEPKQVYGNTLWYPKCHKSKSLCKLAGTKTITEDMIKIIKDLGYSFKSIYEFQF